jgi:hypothetical protein
MEEKQRLRLILIVALIWMLLLFLAFTKGNETKNKPHDYQVDVKGEFIELYNEKDSLISIGSIDSLRLMIDKDNL